MASTLGLITTPLVVWRTRPQADVGSLPGSMRYPDAVSTVQAFPDPVITPSTGISAKQLVVRSARLEDYAPLPHGPRPVELRIDAIGVRAPVVPVGVEERAGSIEVPPDVDTVGWYRFGPSPGSSGSAVLIGHVDSWVQGVGAFFRLRELEPDDVVSVVFAHGSRSLFRVVARRSYPKSELPNELFERTGRPILTLVTCGGTFDPATRSYSDNIVVVAVPFD